VLLVTPAQAQKQTPATIAVLLPLQLLLLLLDLQSLDLQSMALLGLQSLAVTLPCLLGALLVPRKYEPLDVQHARTKPAHPFTQLTPISTSRSGITC
jgi:hypothetical protein